MDLSRFESLTLVAAVIGAAILGAGSHAIAPAVGDISILFALFAFDSSASRSGAQSIAFAAVSGFCLLTPLFFLANNILGAATPSDSSSPWLLSGVWAVATLILFSVDRFRMSAKDNVSLAASGMAAAGFSPGIIATPPNTYRPAPIRVVPPPQPVYAPPAYQPPVYAPPPPPLPPQPAFVTEVPATQPPMPDVTAIPAGREAVIYLNLVGEGLNVLRTVRAENLGRDYFRIADVMPEGEQWEFTPGQVVKCRKKSLSNGKHMVAFEEAPRAQ